MASTISELADRFRAMMGNKSEAAKAEHQTLELTVEKPFGITTTDYLSWDRVAPGFGTTITVTRPKNEEIVVPPQPEAEDVTSVLVDGERAAYRRTCQAIGYEPAALVIEDVLAFMAEKKMRRYDNAKVGEYLTAKAKKALGYYGTWQWRPLRAQDAGDETGRQMDNSGDETPLGKPYQQAIPLRVLARVEQFMQKFGDKVRFLVSDYAEKKPDPFIAVVPNQGGVDPIVFDVWDEPDFK